MTAGIGGHDPELIHKKFLGGSEQERLCVNSDTMQGPGAQVKYLGAKSGII